MAINYTAHVDTPLDMSEFTNQFAQAAHLERSDDGVWHKHGLIIRCYLPGELQSSVILDAFGFKPRITVSFIFDKDYDFGNNVSTMLEMLNVFRNIPIHRYILLANDEQVVLDYRDNQLVLNAQWDDWHKPQYAVIAPPYRIETIHSPLL